MTDDDRNVNIIVTTCKSIPKKKTKQSGEILYYHSFPIEKCVKKEWVYKCYEKYKFYPTNKKSLQ